MKKYILFSGVFVFGLFFYNLSLVGATGPYNEANYIPGCAANAAYSVLSGQKCPAVTIVECSQGDLYSSVTGQPCSGTQNSSQDDSSESVAKFKTLFKTNFKVGVKSDDVKALQQLLKDEGYYFGKVDGKYGRITDRAVKDFQGDNSLNSNVSDRPMPSSNMTNMPPSQMGGQASQDAPHPPYNTSMPGAQGNPPPMPPKPTPMPPFRSGCTSTDGNSPTSGEPCNWNTSTKPTPTSTVSQLNITTPSMLPGVKVGQTYSTSLSSNEMGVPSAFTWSVYGSLPAGLELKSTSCSVVPCQISAVISGIPTTAGTYNFVIGFGAGVPGSFTRSTSKQFYLIVDPAVSGQASTSTSTTSPYDGFASCLKDKGAVFYGTFWCPHCQAEKALFGLSQKLLPYVECSTTDGSAQTAACSSKNITSYPTWEFADGTRLTGEIPLSQLAEKTSCALPQ